MTPIDPTSIGRVLIRANNWIGDVVMISPAVRALRAHFGGARIAILAKSWVLDTLRGDPFYDDVWREYLQMVRRQVGMVDFADLVYLRSHYYLAEQRRSEPEYQLPVPALFGVKEGKIARANRGRDPLYLFAALQRQLGYPEVPRPKPRDDVAARLEALQLKVRELELRLKLIESETRGQVDLSELGKPEIFKDEEESR